MIFSRPAAGSLARRFAFATAALAIVALLLTVVASWWLVERQHTAALRVLSQKEANFHAANVSGTLNAIASRLSEVADSSILATGLVDSAGRETYLTPFLHGIRQINGVPIQILFTDFEGKEISSNGMAQFSGPEIAWLKAHLESGQEEASIFDGPDGPQMVAVELMSYSRTQTPEGALLYKIALREVQTQGVAQLAWDTRTPPQIANDPRAGITVMIDAPPIFQHLHFHIVEPPQTGSSQGLIPQYATIFVIALALAAVVLVIGWRLALTLTQDLQRLEGFSRSVIEGGFGVQRAEPSGSSEVASLARSINHMLDRLYQQHTLLQDEREKFYQLANTIPQLAWMADPDGHVHWYNNRWYEYTGTTPEQMENNGWQSLLDAATLPQVLAYMKTCITEGKPFQTTFPLRGADGVFRPFFTSAAPLRDGSGRIVQWFGTNTDVSQLEKAEQALRESEERLREGLTAARMAVWDWDLSTGHMMFSANWKDIIGQTWEASSQSWDVVHKDDAQRLRDAIDRAIAQRGHFEQVVRMVRPDNGKTIWIDARGNVMNDATGKARSIRGIFLDVTERKRAEEALRAASRRKDEFLAMLAHELRNPLAPINTAAEILKIAHLDPGRVRLTSEIITRQVEHMTSLVDDLLDVSRVTRGLISLEKAPVDIDDIVAGAVEQVRPLIDTKGHRLTLRLGDDSAFVLGDRTRLIQVVSNLLNNSAKYTSDGGEILIAVTAHPESIELSVRDTGIGISAELLPHVFDLFTQAERTPDRSQGGLGLGLALVSSLVELHGGSVEAFSEGLGRGSMFTVHLPRFAQSSEPSLRGKGSESSQAVVVPMQLMIVDDNADAAHSLAVLLEADGHHVTIEYTAQSALERARLDKPQAFLLDIGLPDIDGYELARRLRSQPETAHALLVAVTGYGRKEDRERSQAAGFDYHLVKPASRQELSAIFSKGMRSDVQRSASHEGEDMAELVARNQDNQ